jgi:hypothetical protein
MYKKILVTILSCLFIFWVCFNLFDYKNDIKAIEEEYE